MNTPLENLSTNELHDLLDEKIWNVGRAQYDPAHYRYFDNMEDYDKALVSAGYENPDRVSHELSHGRCALAVGVTAVGYGIEYDTRLNVPTRAITSLFGPSVIPNLALAAIAAAPANPSPRDLAWMRRLGYPTIEHLHVRIDKWNSAGKGLIIPLPGTIDVDT